MWLGFQSGSEHMLQRLYLMCKAKHHKSQKHSSVFPIGSVNHSEDEKADTSLFSGAEWKLSGFRFFWLLLHLSSCDFCFETVGKGDIQLLSATVQCVLSYRSSMFGFTCSLVYIIMTNTFISVWLFFNFFGEGVLKKQHDLIAWYFHFLVYFSCRQLIKKWISQFQTYLIWSV